MDRIDKVNAGILVALCALLGVIVMYGPAEHKTVAATAFFGLVAALSTALRGRLIKRDPETAAKDAAAKVATVDDEGGAS